MFYVKAINISKHHVLCCRWFRYNMHMYVSSSLVHTHSKSISAEPIATQSTLLTYLSNETVRVEFVLTWEEIKGSGDKREAAY